MVATIAETSTSNPTSEYWASPRQYLNKSESSSYTANGDLTIKSVFVNMAVSSAILNSQAGYRCTLVPRIPFPVQGSLFFVPRSSFPIPSFNNIPYDHCLDASITKMYAGITTT